MSNKKNDKPAGILKKEPKYSKTPEKDSQDRSSTIDEKTQKVTFSDKGSSQKFDPTSPSIRIKAVDSSLRKPTRPAEEPNKDASPRKPTRPAEEPNKDTSLKKPTRSKEEPLNQDRWNANPELREQSKSAVKGLKDNGATFSKKKVRGNLGKMMASATVPVVNKGDDVSRSK